MSKVKYMVMYFCVLAISVLAGFMILKQIDRTYDASIEHSVILNDFARDGLRSKAYSLVTSKNKDGGYDVTCLDRGHGFIMTTGKDGNYHLLGLSADVYCVNPDVEQNVVNDGGGHYTLYVHC